MNGTDVQTKLRHESKLRMDSLKDVWEIALSTIADPNAHFVHTDESREKNVQ